MHRWTDDGRGDPLEAYGRRIVGEAVRRSRLGSGTSQRQLAFRCALNQSTISRLETGRLRAMRFVTLARVIGALNLPGAYLTPGGPPPPTRRLPGEPAR